MSLSEDDLIDRFLKGELTYEEAENFRKRLESDQEFAQRVTLEKQLFEVLNEEDWSQADNPKHEEVTEYTALFSSEETERIKAAIAGGQSAYKEQTETPVKRIRAWWTYPSAAALLLLISFLFIFPRKDSPQDLYSSYLAKTELPSVISRNAEDANNNLVKGQKLYENKSYKEVVDLLVGNEEQYTENAAFYIYLALSQSEVKQYIEAQNTIDALINSDLLDSEKGYWFKSLVHLKAEEVSQAKEILMSIVDKKYFNYKLAVELLEEL